MKKIQNKRRPNYHVIKIIILSIISTTFTIGTHAQETKSYMMTSLVTFNEYGPKHNETSGKTGCYITWDNKNNMIVSDDTKWKYAGNNSDGSMRYVFDGLTGKYPIEPMTTYTYATVSSDKKMVKIACQFGMGTFYMQMINVYVILGDGIEPLNRYIKGGN